MVEYTHIVPLGSNCRLTHNLRKFYDQSESFPFDWWLSPLNGIVNVIESALDIDLIYDVNSLSYEYNKSRTHYHVINSSLGIVFSHEFPNMPLTLSSLINWREKIIRPRERFSYLSKKLLALNVPGNKILFVRNCVTDKSEFDIDDKEGIIRLDASLRKLFHKANIDLLLINTPFSPNLSKSISIIDNSCDWQGDYELWSSALKACDVSFRNINAKKYAADFQEMQLDNYSSNVPIKINKNKNIIMRLANFMKTAFPKKKTQIIPGFDPDFYVHTYADVAESGLSPADHYRQIGRDEHRDPNAHFGAKAYLAAHPDVAAAGFDPLSHFMVHGLAQNYDGWRRAPDNDGAPAGTAPTAAAYRVPDDLTATASGPETILVVGSCLVENLVAEFARVRPVQGDFVLANFASRLPEAPPRGLDGYDLQIVQLPLRAILPDNCFAHLRYQRPDEYSALFASAEQRLATMLDAAMAWNRASGLTTFVVNFLRPQQNPLGRLTPKNDLRNFAYFIDRLNERLADLVAGYANSYVLDFDEIAATIGRMHVQDDHLWMLNHNSTLSDFDHAYDQRRLHPPEPISRRSDLKIEAFFDAVQAEVEAMYRAIRQTDAVKLVIVDLDDTLWRGVIAEEGDLEPAVYEGWPLGLIEALCFVKHRGIVLAIASKNDEAKIRAIWDPLLGGRLRLSDFGVVRINWNPKVDNVAEILEQVNVLPGSVVFIDDNPVERASVAAAFPGIRTLGADLYGIRRALLWSSEMQGPPITDESGRRTEMIQAQVVREQTRKVLSREAFLATLDITITPDTIAEAGHPRFRRAFELINKTNQFNTTGRRWTLEEMQAAFANGLRLHAFEVADRFTEYGLVGVVVREGATLTQCVMSCRVIGLDVEAAMLAYAAAEAGRDRHGRLEALYVPTGRNDLCAGLYREAGYHEAGDRWVRDLS